MIFFIDDEPIYIKSYVEELRGSGYDVHVERQIDSAVKCLEERLNQVERAIFDVMMPPGNIFKDIDTFVGLRTGFALYDWIRQRTNCPVIVLTNAAGPDIDAKFSGAERCLLVRKAECYPFELAAHVKQMLEQRTIGDTY